MTYTAIANDSSIWSVNPGFKELRITGNTISWSWATNSLSSTIAMKILLIVETHEVEAIEESPNDSSSAAF